MYNILVKEVLYMPYFTIEKTFLIPSLELSFEEKKKIDIFLTILEDSGVGEIIETATRKTYSAGRKSYNPYRLFAAIIYGFSKHSGSVRKIEESIFYDLRFIHLMEQERPSYVTISSFLKNIIAPNHLEIFSKIIKTVIRYFAINIDDVFLDGSKFEANANKYKFVRKPTTFHLKLDLKIKTLLEKYICIPTNKKSFTSKEIAEYLVKIIEIAKEKNIELESIKFGKGSRIPEIAKDLKKLNSFLTKSLEYEEKEQICGVRNSYYKTDKDATAMCLKQDYYSGLGSNMHAGYNVQLIVSKGIILAYYVGQHTNDFYEFIPTLQRFYDNFGFYPKRICADSGYGSLLNYRFLKEHNIENFVKYNLWRQDVLSLNFNYFHFTSDHKLVCLNNKIAREDTSYNGRHIHNKNNRYYIIDDCRRCRYKRICFIPIKNKNKHTRVFETNEEMYWFKKEAMANLLSRKGIEMRVNRSSQVEGVFGIIKQDMNYERIRRRGLENVSAEIMLVCLGLVIRKAFGLLSGTASINYREAPKELEDEKIPPLNIKKLLNKKKRQKGKNEKLRKEYKKHKKKFIS